MPRVAQYEPNQVSSQLVSQPRASADAPSAAFGAPVAQGLSNLAAEGLKMKDRIDTTEAEEAGVLFEKAKNDLFFNPDTGYFNTAGRNAYDGAASAAKSLEELKKKFGGTLSEGARRKFESFADAHIVRGQADIQRHSAKGFKAWEIGNQKAIAEKSIESGALYWNNPERVSEQLEQGVEAVRESGKMSGAGEIEIQENVETYRSSFARGVIETAMQSSSAEAEELMGSMEKLLEPQDMRAINKALTAQKEKEQNAADAAEFVTFAESVVTNFDTRREVREQVEGKYADDPVKRKKAMAEAMAQFNAREQVKDEENKDAFDLGDNYIAVPGQTAEMFKAEHPEQWAMLTEKQKRKLEQGVSVETDWVAYADLIMTADFKSPEFRIADHLHYLAEPERRTVIGMMKAARSGKGSDPSSSLSSAITWSTQVDNVLTQLTGKKKAKWNDRELQYAQEFWSRLQTDLTQFETEKGSKATPEEKTRILNEYTRKATIGGITLPFLGTVAQDEVFIENITIEDVPDDVRQDASEALRARGQPVTDDTILKMYKWQLGRQDQ